MRPHQRLAVDVLFEDAAAQHRPEMVPGAPPRGIGCLADDVALAPAPRRKSLSRPGFGGLPPVIQRSRLPAPSGRWS
jgi:hypothetical protein